MSTHILLILLVLCIFKIHSIFSWRTTWLLMKGANYTELTDLIVVLNYGKFESETTSLRSFLSCYMSVNSSLLLY